MADRPKERVYKDAELQQLLRERLPHWRFEQGHICRAYRTASWKATLMVVNTIGHLAEAAWHHPDLAVSYATVEVRLMTHTAKGITDKDLELAAKIEEVIQWQPARAGGALEGTPEGDERFAYITYDD
ncbi:4a-hydroxytetrahydrobiopterin dehydratase [Rhodovastum atsumiense]|uniref:4a-hydroxytetrahydrobiopterin dehydratase n=1 Tax=Rhodovastum atsumiense TaxID=504468 RepID=A0A5M6IQI0_9PROT|nr:4a-hydroxytetrahydrobiopterin dehydratase [Rhodovastum atsumiense]KAA5610522.1 4a-hydroxytetrahydrobiopterin dehydratase [Rhodovastum atsumiense]CAH2605034.1 4a-hydroxytetrahydrobiopterin dehydratase [Rhodovastum atsumiense]